jgi:hypothetical protein
VFIVAYFVINSVWELLDTLSYVHVTQHDIDILDMIRLTLATDRISGVERTEPKTINPQSYPPLVENGLETDSIYYDFAVDSLGNLSELMTLLSVFVPRG